MVVWRQGDDGLLGLMYQSAMREDPALHAKLHGEERGNTERAEASARAHAHAHSLTH